jgi:hypothetical protein
MRCLHNRLFMNGVVRLGMHVAIERVPILLQKATHMPRHSLSGGAKRVRAAYCPMIGAQDPLPCQNGVLD